MIEKFRRTKDRVVVGYGWGITGPTSPTCTGVTVRQSILHHDWMEKKGPYPEDTDHYVIVSSGIRTIAIFPCQYEDGGIEEAEANARIFANALNELNGSK